MNWINIKNNNPPINVRVLFYMDYMESLHEHPPKRVKKVIVGKILKNSPYVTGDHWQYLKLGITHWMPLPEEPEETKETSVRPLKHTG